MVSLVLHSLLTDPSYTAGATCELRASYTPGNTCERGQFVPSWTSSSGSNWSCRPGPQCPPCWPLWDSPSGSSDSLLHLWVCVVVWRPAPSHTQWWTPFPQKAPETSIPDLCGIKDKTSHVLQVQRCEVSQLTVLCTALFSIAKLWLQNH